MTILTRHCVVGVFLLVMYVLAIVLALRNTCTTADIIITIFYIIKIKEQVVYTNS